MKKFGRPPIDWSKRKVGRLQPLFDSGERRGISKRVIWWCKCDCGNIVKISTRALDNKGLRSCGCVRREKFWKHGGYGTKLYNSWSCMKRRCYNPNDPKYKNYGKRGIDVCDEWKNSFKAFKNWALSNGYERGLTIDKIDNNRGYSPENCQWITRSRNSKKYWEVDKWNKN